jgi:hypothetical protein
MKYTLILTLLLSACSNNVKMIKYKTGNNVCYEYIETTACGVHLRKCQSLSMSGHIIEEILCASDVRKVFD